MNTVLRNKQWTNHHRLAGHKSLSGAGPRTNRIVHDEVDHAFLAVALLAGERMPIVRGLPAGYHTVRDL